MVHWSFRTITKRCASSSSWTHFKILLFWDTPDSREPTLDLTGVQLPFSSRGGPKNGLIHPSSSSAAFFFIVGKIEVCTPVSTTGLPSKISTPTPTQHCSRMSGWHRYFHQTQSVQCSLSCAYKGRGRVEDRV